MKLKLFCNEFKHKLLMDLTEARKAWSGGLEAGGWGRTPVSRSRCESPARPNWISRGQAIGNLLQKIKTPYRSC